MAKKKPEEEPCGNWMDTYGDMVTLLLTFFVFLFSMSTVSEEKFAELVKAFTSASPDTINVILNQDGELEGEYAINRSDQPATAETLTNEELAQAKPESFNELYEYIKAYTERNNMQDAVQVSQNGEGVVYIRFQDNLFFDPDRAELRQDSMPLLDFLGSCLKSVEDQIMTVNIDGHTADPGIPNYAISDWKLSSERAANVAIFFEEQKGFAPQKLLPIGYGKNFPIADNSTPEGREQNRRVDMVIISNDTDLSDSEILQMILDGTFDAETYPASGSATDILVPDQADGSASSAAEPSASSSGPDATLSQPEVPVVSSPTVEPVNSAGSTPSAPENPASMADISQAASNGEVTSKMEPSASSSTVEVHSPYEG